MREDRGVILAIILGTSVLLAAWAGHWWSSVLLGVKVNRASRMASIISPFLIAGVFAWTAGSLLDAIGVDIGSVANLNPKEIAVIFFAVAILLLIPTVLIATLAGQLFDKCTPAKNQRAF